MIEIMPLQSKQSRDVIECLKIIFSTHGIPKVMISDNMPFASMEMARFSKSWNFEIRTSSPTYPRSNGQVEKAVHIAKNLMKKAREDGKDFRYALLEYRNHPVAQMTASPSQILMSRITRTKLPIKDRLLEPKVQNGIKVELIKNQQKVKVYHDKSAKRQPQLKPEDNVVYLKNGLWEPARVVAKHESPRSYIIKKPDQTILRRNRVHLRKSAGDYLSHYRESELEGDVTPPQGEAPILEPRVQDEQPIIEPPVLNQGSPQIERFSRFGRVLRPPMRMRDYVT